MPALVLGERHTDMVVDAGTWRSCRPPSSATHETARYSLSWFLLSQARRSSEYVVLLRCGTMIATLTTRDGTRSLSTGFRRGRPVCFMTSCNGTPSPRSTSLATRRLTCTLVVAV